MHFVACFAELTLHPPIVAELVWHLLQLSGLVAAYSSSDPFLSESVMAILTQASVRRVRRACVASWPSLLVMQVLCS